MERIKLAIAAVVAVVLASTGVAWAVGSGGAAAAQISIGTHNTHYGDASFERFAGVIGWQEVESPAAIAKLRNRLGGEYDHYLSAAAGPRRRSRSRGASTGSRSWVRAASGRTAARRA